MLKVGITGGIGSGKTTISQIFTLLEIPVYNADTRAKDIIQTDKALITQIKSIFGKDIYTKNYRLDKKKLASIVFNNKNALEQLNTLVHPKVKDDFIQWVAEQKNAPFILKEAALIFETDSHKTLDYVITVYAPKELRIARLLKRKTMTTKMIQARMATQIGEKEKKQQADFVIYNDEKHLVIPQVLRVHKKIVNS